MKAIVYEQYGLPSVLQFREIATPTPADDEVLIKVRAASANPLDWRVMGGMPLPLRLVVGMHKPSLARPARPGVDVAGVVESVGGNITRLKPGDQVFGTCKGAFAEYACAREQELAMKPENMSFEQAASVPIAAVTALQGLRDKGRIQPGQKVLINGAAGGVGSFAVQIAKSFGAEVTGVCSTRNVEMVRSIGADHVIDYTREDFARSGQRYDLCLDCHVNHSLWDCRRVLNPGGIYVLVGGPTGGLIAALVGFFGALLIMLVLSPFASRKLAVFMARMNKEDLNCLRELMEAGTVRPVIDRRYSLREVPEAIRYLKEGHARGKVVITLE
ncbi:MAG: NAD(P)-dependent alcohol dehydrogenase [Terracidiphilus sp.]|jgi:NADPH:quinone reductase-like Zn-dependent oxidoreductase